MKVITRVTTPIVPHELVAVYLRVSTPPLVAVTVVELPVIGEMRARLVSERDHVPPAVVEVKVKVAPGQITVEEPEMAPMPELTDTTFRAINVPQLFTTVYRIESEPELIPVSTPVALMDVMEVFSVLQVPPAVVLVHVMDEPIQVDARAEIAPTPEAST